MFLHPLPLLFGVVTLVTFLTAEYNEHLSAVMSSSQCLTLLYSPFHQHVTHKPVQICFWLPSMHDSLLFISSLQFIKMFHKFCMFCTECGRQSSATSGASSVTTGT